MINWPPFCLFCELPTLKSGLCSFCLSGFLNLAKSTPEKYKLRDQKGIKHRFAVEWMPDTQPSLNRLMLRLKGGDQGGAITAWALLAEVFVGIQGLKATDERLFVPIPGKGQDHAYQFALGLQDILGGKIIGGLQLKKLRSQKTLKRSERKNLEFTGHLEEIPAKSNIVVVDDILTTGATCEALINPYLVKRLIDIEIWTLAYRGNLKT